MENASRLATLLSASIAFGAGSAAAASEMGSSQQQILGGTQSDDRAVVAITHKRTAFCTGTLVSKRIVATAAHCVAPHIDFDPKDVEIFFGDDMGREGGIYISAISGVAHPDWAADKIHDDVGVYRLSEDAPVLPVFLPGTPLNEDFVGTAVRVVGFGVSESTTGSSGIRHAGEMIVDAIDSKAIYLTPEQSTTCNGDSGGTLFGNGFGNTQVFLGIHSRSRCEIGDSSSAIDERLDSSIEFFAPFLAEDADSIRTADPSCQMDNVCNEDCVFDVDCAEEIYTSEGSAGGCSSTGSSSNGLWFCLLLLVAFRSPRLR